MCYSVQASIGALLTGVLGAVLLGWQGGSSEVILAILFLWVVCMQIFDAIFWLTEKHVKEGDPGAHKINAFFSKVAMLFNHTQPLVLAALIVACKQRLPLLSVVTLVVYVVIALVYSVQVWDSVDVTMEEPPASPGLYWKWTMGSNYKLMYTSFVACIAVLMVQNLDAPANWMGLALTVGTLFFSIERFGGKSDAGRWWCNYAAYIPLVYLILAPTKRRWRT